MYILYRLRRRGQQQEQQCRRCRSISSGGGAGGEQRRRRQQLDRKTSQENDEMTTLPESQRHHYEYKPLRNGGSGSEENMLSRDWRQALRTPHVYRVGNSTLRVQSHFVVFIMFLVLVVFFYYGYPLLKSMLCSQPMQDNLPPCQYYFYNKTYPLTAPIRQFTGVSYTIAIVSDLDTESKSPDQPNTWRSFLKRGRLTWMPMRNLISVKWDEEMTTLTSSLGMKGRGMELSELVTFDGRLLTFDDRTGMVYFFDGDKVYPWVILMDGNGKSSKGLLF